MPVPQLLTEKQENRIVDAIARAEHQSSGEVRVHIEEHCHKDALKRADTLFKNLGMTHTERQNGVLIYIASEDKKAAVYAGKGIHKQVEEGFWNDVLKVLLNHFKSGHFDQGIVEAVDMVGLKLSELFPYQQDDVNELSDEISYGKDDE